ncbi:MAG TPA: VWA domain-containing protein [Pyrinomonadaceae bacterium]|jgi:VWFA-related protein|nr:VWA domain-containing protein [Pyrinomonadaceae bacterium]
MKKRLSLALAIFLAPLHAHAQLPTQTPTAQTPTAPQRREENPYEDEVVRITTNLVQFDAVVTDKQGRLVTDLRPEEFELTVDGKRRQVSNFSYVDLSGATLRAAESQAKGVNSKSDAPPVPPARLRPEQVRRTIALVVDDLGLSFESVARLRSSLKRFVDEQMQPGDLVAVIRTSAGVGALQQFTSDRAVLAAAIERVRWYPQGRAGVSSFAPIEKDEIAEVNRAAATARASGGGTGPTFPQAVGSNRPDNSTNLTDLSDTNDLLDRYREELFAAGTLGALNFVVRGLKELPGRKSVVLLSDSLPIFRKDGRSDSVLENLRRLVDLANRASVRIYSMDARELATLSLRADDNASSLTSSAATAAAGDDRRAGYFESQNGLNYLAAETGGLFIHNTNDVAEGVREVLRDQKGFYLIGYRPDAETFSRDGASLRFNRLEVKAKRPGLTVRTRNGFYGIPEEEAIPARRTRGEQLYGAIISPFFSGGVHVRLTSLFVNDAAAGSFMRSLLHINADGLVFTKQPDGSHVANIDVLAVTFGDAGQVIDSVDRTDAVRVEAGSYEKVLRAGFDYIVNVSIAKPGAYQLRMAVRDASTEKVGSASQFIEVPDLSGGRLTLSGLVLSGNDLPEPAQAGAVNVEARYDPQSSPAVRRLKRGAELFYNFAVYNARAEKGTAKPRLTLQARLFRDGREVYSGRQMPVAAGSQADARQVLAGGRMSLGTQAALGEYVLQVVVTDAPSGERPRTATQWIDFEIVQ